MTRTTTPWAPSPPTPPPPPLMVDAPTAAKMLGVGKTKLRELVLSGAVQSVKIDRRRLFAVKELEAFVARLYRGSEVGG